MHGLPESQLPTARPGLLHEVRIRYVIAQNRVDTLIQKIRDAVYGSMETAEETLGSVYASLVGTKDEAVVKKNEAYKAAEKAAADAEVKAEKLKADAKKIKNEL
jgi:hypothetical protein